MKILGSVTPVGITADVAASFKLNGDDSFFAIPNEILEKHGVKSFDIIESTDNELILVAQSAKAELTKNKPTRLKEVVSNARLFL